MQLSQIEEARAIAPNYPIVLTGLPNGSPGLVLQYIPEWGSGASAANAFVSGTTNLHVKISGVTPTSGDTTGMPTNGKFAFSAYTNMGLLCDRINKVKCLRAYLQGALRGDSAAWLLASQTVSIVGDNGGTLVFDGDKSDCVTVAISGEKFVNNGPRGWVTDADSACENMLCFLAYNMVDDVNIYFYTASQSADSQLAVMAEVSTGTRTLVQADTPEQPYIRAKVGERLVVRATLVTSSANLNTVTEFQIMAKTAVWEGDRLVTEDNF